MATAPRKTRKPLTEGFADRISIKGKDPAYEYFLATDKPGRVDALIERGYQVVTDKETTVGSSRIGLPTSEGTARTMAVGGGETGVLMKIQRDWYEEDQAFKRKKAHDTVSQINKDARENAEYGSVKTDQRED